MAGDNNVRVHRAGRLSFRVVAAILTAVATIATGCGATRSAPPLVLPTNAQPSFIYDSTGRLITTLQQENRTSLPLEEIPALVQNAVVAVEDARFWSHEGVDPQAIARAADSNIDSGESSQGGSTITQQYVKTALLTPAKSLSRKLEEASLAIAIERNYSKQLILELYLNTVYFGNGAYGIDAASRAYFGVGPADLNLAQIALLAGVINAPSRFDPRAAPEKAVERRNLVLRRMSEQGYITGDQEEQATAVPLELVPPAPLPEALPYPAPHFIDAVKQWLLKGTDILGDSQTERFNNLFGGGLRITTTIDLDQQARAEASIREILVGQGTDPRTPDAGLVSIDPQTGYVRAMVGGYDYFGTHEYRQSNLALGTGRQTGSSFKPLVLATALENGITPDQVFAGTTAHKVPGQKDWVPKGRGGTVTDCTIRSDNACYGNIMYHPSVGPAKVVEMGKRLGVRHTELDVYPSAVLGTNLTTVEDMASVYATFANGGIHVPPVYVTKIERVDGTVIYENEHHQEKVLEPEVANAVSSILPGVITSGTGTKANIGRQAAGKTGTTDNNVDAWFCGYTRQLATAVWVGFAQLRENRLVRMEPPNTRIVVNGGTYPAQIWASYMTKALDGQPDQPLFDPAATPPPTTTEPPPNAASLAKVEAPSTATMPDLAGKRTDQAIADVRKAGLEPVRIDVASAAPAGTVTSQSPPSGVELPAGSQVYIESAPGTYTPPGGVPDVRGFGANQAQAELSAQGYTVTLQSAAPPAGTVGATGQLIVPGQVWQTTPAAGQPAPDGRITVYWMPTVESTATTTPGG